MILLIALVQTDLGTRAMSHSAVPRDAEITRTIQNADATQTIKVEPFAQLVTGMSRFLSGLSRAQPFTEASLGLAEWSALAVLIQRDVGVSNSLLAKLLGVSNQRATQIAESLKNANLISVDQSASDSRKNVITISEAGRTKLAAVNLQLEPMIANALGKNVRSLASVNRTIRRYLIPMVKKPAAREARER